MAMKKNKVIELCARGGVAKRFSESWKKHQCNNLFPTGVSARCTNQADFLSLFLCKTIKRLYPSDGSVGTNAPAARTHSFFTHKKMQIPQLYCSMYYVDTAVCAILLPQSRDHSLRQKSLDPQRRRGDCSAAIDMSYYAAA